MRATSFPVILLELLIFPCLDALSDLEARAKFQAVRLDAHAYVAGHAKPGQEKLLKTDVDAKVVSLRHKQDQQDVERLNDSIQLPYMGDTPEVWVAPVDPGLEKVEAKRTVIQVGKANAEDSSTESNKGGSTNLTVGQGGSSQDPYTYGDGNNEDLPPPMITDHHLPTLPVMAIPLVGFLIGTLCVALLVCYPTQNDPPERGSNATRVGMPTWNAKTDAIFSACDRDRDGFLSYTDMQFLARVTNPESPNQFTRGWFKDLCQPIGADPRRGLDREEFRQSLALLGLGHDVDRNYDRVTQVVGTSGMGGGSVGSPSSSGPHTAGTDAGAGPSAPTIQSASSQSADAAGGRRPSTNHC